MKRVLLILLIALLLLGCAKQSAPASETEQAASETVEQPQGELTVGGFIIATVVVGGALFFFRYQSRKRAERYEFYRK